MRKVTLLFAILLSVSFATTSSAFVLTESIENLEAEMGGLKQLKDAVNSDTMRVARKMCAIVAHKAYVEKALKHLEFLEAHANCAKGNLHTVFKKLGGDLLDDVHVGVTETKHNVTRHIHKWEKDAIQLYHKVK